MALALADSIAECGWDLNDQARRYLSWSRTGEYGVNGSAFDIGVTTAASLRKFAAYADARQSGDESPTASGNGSIMRLAPVPIAYKGLFPDRTDELVRRLVESSLPTHASPQCVSACAYMGLVLAGLLHGRAREDVLAPEFVRTHLRDHHLHPEIEEVALGSYRRRGDRSSAPVTSCDHWRPRCGRFTTQAIFEKRCCARSISDTMPTRPARSVDNSPARTLESLGYRRNGATGCSRSNRSWRLGRWLRPLCDRHRLALPVAALVPSCFSGCASSWSGRERAGTGRLSLAGDAFTDCT